MNGKRSARRPIRLWGWITEYSRGSKTYEYRWRHCRRTWSKLDARKEADEEDDGYFWDDPSLWEDLARDACEDYCGGMTPMDWFYEWKGAQESHKLTAGPRLTLLKLALRLE